MGVSTRVTQGCTTPIVENQIGKNTENEMETGTSFNEALSKLRRSLHYPKRDQPKIREQSDAACYAALSLCSWFSR